MVRDRLDNKLAEGDAVLVAVPSPQVLPGRIVKIQSIVQGPNSQQFALINVVLTSPVDQAGYADGIFKVETPTQIET